MRSRWVRLIAVGAACVAIVGAALAGSVPSLAAPADAGFRDFAFGTGVSAPTAKDVQSKLWFNDGLWWGVLFNPTGGKFQIYRLDTASQTWTTTNTTVDARGTVRNDVLWDGTRLYVSSAGINETTASHAPKIRRFSYSSATKTYSLDKGFPVSVPTGGGMQAFVIDRDSTGMLWGTYTQQSKVWMTHTSGNDQTWVAPVVLPSPGATTIKSEDESGVVAYNGHIGIMWGNQNDGTYYWAVHTDGTPDTDWQVSAADQGPAVADNHISLKAVNNDPAGQVFAAVKSSLSNPLDAPLYKLLVLGNDGVWRQYVYGRVMDNHTRGTVVIDQQNRRIYMAAASPCCNGGDIYYKVSSLDSISFSVGLGTPLIKSASDTHINNVTSTKQPLSSATGLAMIAGDDTSRFYLHNQFGLGSGDTTPPETTINSGPAGTVYASSATFTFSSNEAGATFACSLDGGAFNGCTSPHTYTGLADGSHAFQVRATDLPGNTDPTPASLTWTSDTTNLTVVLSPNADAEVDQGTPDTNFGTRTSIAVDNTPSSEGYLSFALSGVTGTILDARLRLYAIDGTLDGPLVYKAGNTWSETGITWNNRPARVGSALDDKAGIPINSWTEYNVTPAITGAGTYTFELAPSSGDGVTFDSREATTNKPQLVLTVRSDTTPPETTIESGPSGPTASSSASFAFSASETGSSFACSLDGAAFSACTSPQSYSNLAQGAHTFEVRATDGAGNTDPTPAGRSWSVDTLAPVAPLLTSPANGSSSTSSTVTVAGSAEAGSTVEVFDGAASQGTTSTDAGGSWTKTLTGVADGSHSYTATARDASGNTSAASSPAHTITVDSTAPQTTIDSGPSGTTTATSAAFTFSANDPGATYACSLDGSAFAACTSPKSYTGLSGGPHTFQVQATDGAGNTDPTPASRSWTIDVTAPTVTGVVPLDGATGVSTGMNIEATFSEAMSGATITSATFTLVLQGTPTPIPATVTFDAITKVATLNPDGPLLVASSYTATVTGGASGVTDASGNPLAEDRVWSFVTESLQDTTPPETAIDSGPTGVTTSTTATFSFSSSEGGSSFACSLDGSAFAACTSPKSYTGLSEGSHTFEVRATDGAGNTDPTPASRSWTVDTVAPTAPVMTSPANGSTTTSSTVTVAGSAEANSTVEVFDGAVSQGTSTADGSGSWTKTLTGVADGSHSYTATARDAAGNTSPASSPAHTITVHSTAPQTTIDSGPSGTTTATSAAFTFSANDPGATFACSLDGAAFAACSSPQSYTGLAEGAHTFEVRATDSFGNTDPSPASRSWTISLALFSDGFESGNFSAWTTMLTGGDGTATVQSADVKTGSFAARLAETAAAGSFAYARKQLDAARTELTVKGDFKILAEGASGGNVPLFRLYDPSGTRIVSLYRQNLDADKIRVTHSGVGFTTTGRLPLNTWGFFELHVIIAGTGTSTLELKLDGNLVYQTTTASLGTAGVVTVQIGNETKAQAFTLVADNISVRG